MYAKKRQIMAFNLVASMWKMKEGQSLLLVGTHHSFEFKLVKDTTYPTALPHPREYLSVFIDEVE